MRIHVGEHLTRRIAEMNTLDDTEALQLPDVVLNTDSIRVIMIGEAPPEDPDDSFYSRAAGPAHLTTLLSLYGAAGAAAESIQDIVSMGIYVTTAVKRPKDGYAVDPALVRAHLPVLEEELRLFPRLGVVMLMGDVAKKAFNMIAKKRSKKNAVPSGPTYKVRKNEFYFEGKRIFPSYVMAGGNLLIEKSKAAMVSEDIQRMLRIIGGG